MFKKILEKQVDGMRVEVRQMTINDLSAVTEIGERCFRNPWTFVDFKREMAHRNAAIQVLADADGITVFGFLCYRYHGTGITIENMAVLSQYQRKGLGTLLVNRLKHILNMGLKRRSWIIHEASELNLCMHLFLRTCGFRARNVIRDGYEPGIDCYEMAFIHLRENGHEERTDAALDDREGVGHGGQVAAEREEQTKGDAA